MASGGLKWCEKKNSPGQKNKVRVGYIAACRRKRWPAHRPLLSRKLETSAPSDSGEYRFELRDSKMVSHCSGYVTVFFNMIFLSLLLHVHNLPFESETSWFFENAYK